MRGVPAKHKIHLNTAIRRCRRQPNGKVSLVNDRGTDEFDHVVLAVHANQALTTLGESASLMEREVLKHFRTSTNTCVLHSDMSVSLE